MNTELYVHKLWRFVFSNVDTRGSKSGHYMLNGIVCKHLFWNIWWSEE